LLVDDPVGGPDAGKVRAARAICNRQRSCGGDPPCDTLERPSDWSMHRFEAQISSSPTVVLSCEVLRDGRLALGTRTEQADGSSQAGELHLLEESTYLALAAWLSGPIEDAWIPAVRDRQAEQLRTAVELYGSGPAAAERLASDALREIPRPLLVRALLLLINSLGPYAHEQLVSRLNQTAPGPEDDELRRRMLEEREGFAYAVAASALLDALERGLGETDELEA
jgi:hypothetical protein